MARTHAFMRIAHHELRVMRSDRSLWLITGLLAALSGYACYNGLAQTEARDRARSEALAAERSGASALSEQLHRVMSGQQAPTPWDNPTDPSLVGTGMARRYAFLPTSPLAPLAFGQSDMYPDTYKITSESRVDFMYDSEIENPWNLLMGRFDLAFVLTYLLPLFVFAWSYNCLSSEREQGTLRMLLAQPVGLRTVAAAKLSVRGLLLLSAGVLLPCAVLLLFRPEARSESGLELLAGFLGLVAAYTVFWLGLALLVESFSRSSALSALLLVCSWVTLVLVVPVLLNLAAERVSPSPSRAELATQTRLITIDSLNQLRERFSTDYQHVNEPERLLPKEGRFEVPERMRAFAMASQQLDERIEGALAEFDRQLAGQQALVDRLGVLSPAIIVHEGLAAVAGNGTQRYQEFQRQVTAFHVQWKQFFLPRVLDGYAISEADLHQIPVWTWHEQPLATLRAQTSLRALQLIAAALALTTLAFRRLRRYSII